MRSTIRLSGALAACSEQELAKLLCVRGVGRDVATFTDLAVALLQPASIEQAVRRLHRDDLRVIVDAHNADAPDAAPPPSPVLLDLGLATTEGVFAEVGDVVTQLLDVQGPLSTGAMPATPEASVAADSSEAWIHRAFTASQQAALAARSAGQGPVPVTKQERASQVAVRKLAERQHAPPQLLHPLLATLERIGALDVRAGHLHLTGRGLAWSTLGHGDRWLLLAAGVLGSLPHELRTELHAHGDLRWLTQTYVPNAFPLTPEEERETFTRLADHAELIGLTHGGVLTETAQALLSGKLERARTLAERAFPQVTPGVYIQPDLSIIAPGPLDPVTGFALLAFTDLDAAGLAATMSVSERSLTRALEEGWSVPRIRDTLTRVSLTPLPQPLEYLLDDLESKVGRLTVTAASDAEHGAVLHTNPALARELLADTRLSLLGLTPVVSASEGTLWARINAEHAVSVLRDARYPASHARAHAPLSEVKPAPIDVLALLRTVLHTEESATSIKKRAACVEVARTLIAARQAHGSVEVVPVLELALKEQALVKVWVVTGGDTHEHKEYTLQPVSLSGNRLRAKDPLAQVERTLQISAIRRIEPVHT